jgi:hypothetical protein
MSATTAAAGSDYIVDWLKRPLLAVAMTREGHDNYIPQSICRVTAPRWGIFNPDTGEFDVENTGVSPDIEVELDPAAWRQGRDPQLEKGVAIGSR